MWIVFALFASLLWGLNYVFAEQIYKSISVATSFAIVFLVSFIVALIAAQGGGNLKSDVATILSSNKLIWLLVGEVVVFIAAEFFIAFSITGKSATLAGLIEISYPLFIALFSYILFKETQMNLATAIGAVFIFGGVFVIYFFNR